MTTVEGQETATTSEPAAAGHRTPPSLTTLPLTSPTDGSATLHGDRLVAEVQNVLGGTPIHCRSPRRRSPLGEGRTPLVPLTDGISAKLDFLMPTLSFKDRGAVLFVTWHCPWSRAGC